MAMAVGLPMAVVSISKALLLVSALGLVLWSVLYGRHDRSSSGERLNFWHRSVQAIAERPWSGFGVGSFNQ